MPEDSDFKTDASLPYRAILKGPTPGDVEVLLIASDDELFWKTDEILRLAQRMVNGASFLIAAATEYQLRAAHAQLKTIEVSLEVAQTASPDGKELN